MRKWIGRAPSTIKSKGHLTSQHMERFLHNLSHSFSQKDTLQCLSIVELFFVRQPPYSSYGNIAVVQSSTIILW